jgi:hypothetical protein
MRIKTSLIIKIKHGRKNVFKKFFEFDKDFSLTPVGLRVMKVIVTLVTIMSLLVGSAMFLSTKEDSSEIVEGASASDSTIAEDEIKQETQEVDMNIVRNGKIGKILLQRKYEKLAGAYFYPNVIQYLPVIDEVLSEKDLDNDELFIQAMFFIGQRESHWNTQSISGQKWGGEHAVGIFQFLPSTFRSVSSGNIYNAEDQIRAFVTMVERGRVREFGTLYLPGINPAAKAYVMGY